MPVLLVILTVYANHSAQTTAIPVQSMSACRQLAAEIRNEFGSTFAGEAPVHVVAKCVQARQERSR